MDKIRVLIIEDEPIVAQDIEETLREGGYGIAGIASRGELAYELFTETEPDLVMLDINLAGNLDGIETAAMIKAKRDIPIIFLTGLSDKGTIARASEVEPDAYITKPFNETQLQASIQSAIKKHSADEHEAKPNGKGSEHFVMNDSIFVKKRGKYHKILIENVLWLEVNDYLLTIITEKGNFPLIYSLGRFIEHLDKDYIVQVHRSYAVNINKVEGFDRTSLRIGDKVIPVSRNSRSSFLQHFRR